MSLMNRLTARGQTGWAAGRSVLLDFLAPQTCCSCGAALDEESLWGATDASRSGGTASDSQPELTGVATNSLGPRMCADCRSRLPEVSRDVCQICSAPVGPYVKTERGCQRCARERFAFERVISLGVYDGELRKLCLSGKHPSGQPLMRWLTEQLWQQRGDVLRSWQCELIIPVPMHWWDRVSRPVHPADTVAETLARSLGIPVSRHLLRLRRKLPKRSRLSPTERRKLPTGSYHCRGGWLFCRLLRGKIILLVDDVLTTGATAHACARALKSAGAQTVYVATLARGLGRR